MNIEEKIDKKLGLDVRHLSEKDYSYKENEGRIELIINIDLSKYDSLLSSYREVLKEYFKDDQIIVLSKIKLNNWKNFLKEIFINKKSRSFTPSFLVIKNSKRLLITRDETTLKIEKLPECPEKTFIYKGYRYKEANTIKL